jgi:hypothetical protein
MVKAKLRDIIVILPGIMGSVLQKDDKDLWAISRQAAWGAVKSLGSSFEELKLDGDDLETEYLGGIKATRLVEDAHIVPGFIKIDGYTKTKQIIIDTFDVIPGDIRESHPANFFEFPYDWRRDNRINAKILKKHLDQRLKEWREFSGVEDAKVILLAHSMGGLISRYYLEVLEGWRDTKALFTFGTPYRGSPMALDYLVNGYKKHCLDLTRVIRSLPSAYQLLPIYEMLNFDGKDYRIAEAPITLPNISKEWAEDALRFHREIESAVDKHRGDDEYVQNGYKIVPFVGTQQPTLQSAQLIDGLMTVSTDLPTSFDPLWEKGDGTVPYISAVPIELSNDFRATYLSERHESLQRHPKVLGELRDRITASQARGSGKVRGPEIVSGGYSSPALSLVLDDLYLPDETIDIRVQLLNFTRDPVGVKAKITSVSGAISFDLDLQRQEQDWKLELGDLPADLYRVSCLASGSSDCVNGLFEIVP